MDKSVQLSAEQIIICEPDFSSKWEPTRNYCLRIKGITIFRGLEANCQWIKKQIETAFAEAYARAAEEREQARNLFWPPEDEFEEHIYEIRNGKTADYVKAHALALAGTFVGVGESPAAAPRHETLPVDLEAVLYVVEELSPSCQVWTPVQFGSFVGEQETEALAMLEQFVATYPMRQFRVARYLRDDQ